MNVTRLVLAGLLAGLVLWALSAVYAAVYLHAGLPSAMPAQFVWRPVVWDLVEYPLAVFVGAFAYRVPK